jgi:tripartite-type tricarboxylate transporter receptor subunit TctC
MRAFLKPGSANANAWDVLETNLNVGQSFYAPPGVPADRVAILRKAFEDTLKDPELIAEAGKRRVPIVTRTAAEIEKAIHAGYNSATPEVVATITRLMGFGQKAKKK